MHEVLRLKSWFLGCPSNHGYDAAVRKVVNEDKCTHVCFPNQSGLLRCTRLADHWSDYLQRGKRKRTGGDETAHALPGLSASTIAADVE